MKSERSDNNSANRVAQPICSRCDAPLHLAMSLGDASPEPTIGTCGGCGRWRPVTGIDGSDLLTDAEQIVTVMSIGALARLFDEHRLFRHCGELRSDSPDLFLETDRGVVAVPWRAWSELVSPVAADAILSYWRRVGTLIACVGGDL